MRPAAVIVSALAPAWLASAALYNQVIDTTYGAVQGIAAFASQPSTNISNWADITVWKGIPFAADTSGLNRFRPPQKRAAWNTTWLTSEYGDVCPGQNSFGGPPTKRKRQTGGSTSDNTTSSEDCLNLNIWTSANSTEPKLPVMIWSYPAGGSAAQPLFDGAGMAAKGIVYVNSNYRNA
jgi:carboxylesterase 2